MNQLKEPYIVKKPWGHERWFAWVPGKYLGKKLIINSGQTISYHVHKKKEETLYVEKGICGVEINTEVKTYYPGDFFHILPGQEHRMFSQLGEKIVLTEVSTCFPDDSIRIKDFYDREVEE